MSKTQSLTLENIGYSILFVIAFGFQPLFSSNQNTKFLQGVSNAGFGFLNNDWLANTVDPLPVFTSLIQAVFQYSQPFVIYVIQAALVFIYAFFSFKLVHHVFQFKQQKTWLLFLAYFFLIHSPIIFDDIYWGYSGQYLFAQYLQPSSFSIFYIPAVYYFLKKKYYLSGFLMGIPGLFHGAYTLVGAILFISCFSYILIKEKKLFQVIAAGLIFSAVMMPAVITQLTLLSSTSDGLTREAMHIISEYRIPHHTEITSIFQFDFSIKTLALIATLVLLKHQKSKWILTALTVFMVLTILYAFVSRNSVVSVSTPWRFSVIYVPLVFTLLAGIVANKLSNKLPNYSNAILTITLAFFTVNGVLWTNNAWKEYKANYGMQAIEWIANQNKQFKNATFLVESEAIYSERFRLETGVPIYINWKSHPYKDVEVIEWYNRLEQNNRFYNNEMSQAEQLEFIQNNAITHAVVPKNTALNYPSIYEDNEVKIYELAQLLQ